MVRCLTVNSRLVGVGDTFGRWRVIGQPFRCGPSVAVVVACECGTIAAVNTQVLRDGRSKSCGCYAKEVASQRFKTHGLTKHKLYGVFNAMWTRCTNPNSKSYNDYGGRGIFVCEEWCSFEAFFAWATSNGWEPGKEIDRIENDGPYGPGNCRFIARLKNARNKRNNVLVVAFGEAKIPPEWAADPRCVVSEICIRKRIGRGWTDGEAILTTPARVTLSP